MNPRERKLMIIKAKPGDMITLYSYHYGRCLIQRRFPYSTLGIMGVGVEEYNHLIGRELEIASIHVNKYWADDRHSPLEDTFFIVDKEDGILVVPAILVKGVHRKKGGTHGNNLGWKA